MLFLVWVVVFLIFVYVYGERKRKAILTGFASKKGLASLVPGLFNFSLGQGDEPGRGKNKPRKSSPRTRRRVKAFFILFALVLMVISLSGPRYGYHWEKVEHKGIDIIVALDCSRSMLAEDISPTRLDRAKREVLDLIRMLRGDRAGIVAFSGTAFLQCPLTLDYSAFHIFLHALEPGFFSVGGTNIAQALETAGKGFDEKTGSDRAVILITDGEHTGEGSPAEVAQKLQKEGIRVFCVGVGSKEAVPVPGKDGGFQKDDAGNIVLSRLDEDLLKKIAAITSGTYVRSVAGDMDLDRIYEKDIRKKMQAETHESGRIRVWENRYQWFAGLAFFLLIAELLISSNGRKNPAQLIVLVLIFSLPHTGYTEESAHRLAEKGYAAFQKGEKEKALGLFEEAGLYAPENPRILYNIGAAALEAGDYDTAKRHLEEAMKHAEKGKLQQDIQYNLGNALFHLGEYEKAIESYEKAREIAKENGKPDDPEAKDNIAYVKKVMNQPKPPQDEQDQSGDCDNKEDKNTPGDTEKEEKGKSGEEKKNGQERQAPAKPDEKEEKGQNPQQNEEKKSPEEEEKKPQPGKEEKREGTEKEQARAAKPGENGEDSGEPVQTADRILNRLKDEPGKAMMPPSYGKQKVEKDW